MDFTGKCRAHEKEFVLVIHELAVFDDVGPALKKCPRDPMKKALLVRAVNQKNRTLGGVAHGSEGQQALCR